MLRQELLPPALDAKKVSYLEKLAEEVIHRLDSGENYLEHISEFNHLTGKTQDIGDFYYIGDFDGAAGSMGMRTFVERALMPPACKVSGVTDEEVLEMLKIFRQMNPVKAEWDFFS